METIKYIRVSATSNCNVKCWYCFNERQSFNRLTLGDLKSFEWLVNTLVSEYATEIIRFTGGEPLENPHICELIKITKNTGIKKVGLTTNGKILHNFANKLITSGVDDIAVHLYELDLNPVNEKRIIDSIKWISDTFKNVKFNIVVTMRNLKYMEKIIDFSIQNNVNLLLLDLLQAGFTNEVFEENFCSLNGVRELLLSRGLTEVVENDNSKIYKKTNNNSGIKLVEHYADYSEKNSYCTKNLPFHPILLTPDFNFSICTHFGGRSFSIADAVKKQDKNILKNAVYDFKAELSHCKDCSRYTVLK